MNEDNDGPIEWYMLKDSVNITYSILNPAWWGGVEKRCTEVVIAKSEPEKY